MIDTSVLDKPGEPSKWFPRGLLPGQEKSLQLLCKLTTVAVCYLTPLGGGKTWFGARWLISRATTFPKSLHLATNNSYPQCLNVVIPAIHEALNEWKIPYKFIKSKERLAFNLKNSGRIIVSSTETHPRLRGLELGSWWGDETRDASEDSVDTITGRLRCKHVVRPQALYTTTPHGRNHIYRDFVQKPIDGYYLVRGGRSAITGEDYYKRLLNKYDPQLAAQECNAEFVAFGTGLVLKSFDRNKNVSEDIKHDPREVLHLGADFGSIVTLTVQQLNKATNRWLILDCVQVTGTIFEACEKLKKRGWSAHISGWHLQPDPAGRARGQTGFTDHQLLSQALHLLGFCRISMEPLGKAPAVRDKTNILNALLKTADGTRRLIIHPRAEIWINDAENTMWCKNEKDWDKGPKNEWTHAIDSSFYTYAKYENILPFQRQTYSNNGIWQPTK